MNKADIGLMGLAVMGENLILNMESKDLRFQFLIGHYLKSIILLTEEQKVKI